MKKTLAILSLAATVLTAGSVFAQGNPDTALFEQRLKQQYPSTTFKSIRTTPIAGIFEVQMGENLAYIDASGRYFMFGRLYDMPQQQDLTEGRLAEISRVDVSQFPIADAIKTVKGNGSRVLYVFSDPDCPFCKRLESSLRNLTDVTIYTFLYPLEQLHPDAKRKANNIWCMPSRSTAWDALMLEGKEPLDASCATPVDRTIALGNKLGITGTPTMFSGDGRKRAGAAEAQSINVWLDQAKKVAQQ